MKISASSESIRKSADSRIPRDLPALISVPYLLSAFILCLAFPLHPGVAQVILTAAVVALLLSSTNSPAALPKNFWWLTAGFISASVMACVLSVDPGVSITASISMLTGGFLLLACSHVNAVNTLYILLKVFCGAGLLIAVVFAGIAFTHPGALAEQWIGLAAYPHIGVPNDLSLLTVVIVLAASMLAITKPSVNYLFLVLTIAVSIACLLIYQSRGGLLVAAILIATLTLQHRHANWRYILPGIAVLGILIDGIMGFTFLQKLTQLNTLSSRIPLWIAAFNMFLDSPWFGHGPGAFALLYRDFLVVDQLPDWIIFDDRTMPWPHNLYLELLAERGLFGLLSFSALIAYLIWMLYQCYTLVDSPEVKSLAITLIYGLTAPLLLGLFESSLLRHWVIIVFTFIAGLACALWKINYVEISGKKHKLQ